MNKTQKTTNAAEHLYIHALPALKKDSTLSYGTIVQSISAQLWLVEPEPGVCTIENQLTASPTFSCLIEPAIGDKVLLAPPAQEGAWHILAIIARSENIPTKLTLPGQCAAISVPDGSLDITSKDALNLTGEKQLNLTTPSLDATSNSIHVHSERAQVNVGVMQCLCSAIAFVAHSVDQIVNRFTQKITNSQRHILDRDETFAGTSITMAKDLVSLQGRNARINAEKNIVVNADKIHMG